MVGYIGSDKAYKLYNMDSGSIFISKDVIFHEDIFPFMQQKSSPSSAITLLVSDLDSYPIYVYEFPINFES